MYIHPPPTMSPTTNFLLGVFESIVRSAVIWWPDPFTPSLFVLSCHTHYYNLLYTLPRFLFHISYNLSIRIESHRFLRYSCRILRMRYSCRLSCYSYVSPLDSTTTPLNSPRPSPRFLVIPLSFHSCVNPLDILSNSFTSMSFLSIPPPRPSYVFHGITLSFLPTPLNSYVTPTSTALPTLLYSTLYSTITTPPPSIKTPFLIVPTTITTPYYSLLLPHLLGPSSYYHHYICPTTSTVYYCNYY